MILLSKGLGLEESPPLLLMNAEEAYGSANTLMAVPLSPLEKTQAFAILLLEVSFAVRAGFAVAVLAKIAGQVSHAD